MNVNCIKIPIIPISTQWKMRQNITVYKSDCKNQIVVQLDEILLMNQRSLVDAQRIHIPLEVIAPFYQMKLLGIARESNELLFN